MDRRVPRPSSSATSAGLRVGKASEVSDAIPQAQISCCPTSTSYVVRRAGEGGVGHQVECAILPSSRSSHAPRQPSGHRRGPEIETTPRTHLRNRPELLTRATFERQIHSLGVRPDPPGAGGRQPTNRGATLVGVDRRRANRHLPRDYESPDRYLVRNGLGGPATFPALPVAGLGSATRHHRRSVSGLFWTGAPRIRICCRP